MRNESLSAWGVNSKVLLKRTQARDTVLRLTERHPAPCATFTVSAVTQALAHDARLLVYKLYSFLTCGLQC